MAAKADINFELLNTVLPIKDGDILFQCKVDLDGSFEEISTTKIYKLEAGKEGYQFFDVYKKRKDNHANGEEWSIGFNYFKEGESFYYQPFMWRKDQPKQGKLKDHNPHNYCTNGDAVRFDGKSFTSATVKEGYEGKGAGYTCTVIPIVLDFDATGGSIAISDPLSTLKPVAVKTSQLINTTDRAGSYETGFSQTIAQSLKTSVSTTLTFKQGLTITWEKKFSSGFFQGKWTAAASITFEQSTNKSTDTSKAEEYTVSEKVTVPIAANSYKYVSLVVNTDQNASADIVAVLNVKGTLFGEPLNGTELSRIIRNSDTLDFTTAADSISYNLKGKITANVITNSTVAITDRAPTPEDLIGLFAT